MPQHHSHDDVIAAASPADEHGVRTCTVQMRKGDTTWAPGTTKYDLMAYGPAAVVYTLYPEGAEARLVGKLGRTLRNPLG